MTRLSFVLAFAAGFLALDHFAFQGKYLAIAARLFGEILRHAR